MAPTVELRPLSARAYPAYRYHLVHHYARDKVEAGVWSEAEAGGLAAAEVDAALPDGVATAGHFLCSVVDPSSPAELGKVCLAARDSTTGRAVWIYDIEIHKEFRRRGYGVQTLKLMEEKAGELGANRVELHVFGHNTSARALYEKLDYATQSVVMVRRLGREA